MVGGLCAAAVRRDHASRDESIPAATIRRPRGSRRRLFMTWQTPTATDFRFGFEITMYVAAR
jgi:coenzyme PQQ precursor peptide PqqA